MSRASRSTLRLNDLLRQEFGSPSVHPLIQWRHSADLWTMMPVLDANQQPILDYHCACGVNRNIHRESCAGIVASIVRLERIPIYPFTRPEMTNRWVLSRWIPPPPEDQWAKSFGSKEDWPANGTYVPLALRVGAAQRQVILRDGVEPDLVLTEDAIKAIRSGSTIQELEAEMRHKESLLTDRAELDAKGNVLYTPPPESAWARSFAEIKDRMTKNGQIPGSKGSVSYPSGKLVN